MQESVQKVIAIMEFLLQGAILCSFNSIEVLTVCSFWLKYYKDNCIKNQMGGYKDFTVTLTQAQYTAEYTTSQKAQLPRITALTTR